MGNSHACVVMLPTVSIRELSSGCMYTHIGGVQCHFTITDTAEIRQYLSPLEKIQRLLGKVEKTLLYESI